jgi:hypothetical protein
VRDLSRDSSLAEGDVIYEKMSEQADEERNELIQRTRLCEIG